MKNHFNILQVLSIRSSLVFAVLFILSFHDLSSYFFVFFLVCWQFPPTTYWILIYFVTQLLNFMDKDFENNRYYPKLKKKKITGAKSYKACYDSHFMIGKTHRPDRSCRGLGRSRRGSAAWFGGGSSGNSRARIASVHRRLAIPAFQLLSDKFLHLVSFQVSLPVFTTAVLLKKREASPQAWKNSSRDHALSVFNLVSS